MGRCNDAGATAGALASAAGHTEVVDYLASLVEEVRTPEEARAALDSLGIDYTERAFLTAARDGDLDVVKLFVWAGMSVNATNRGGFTALLSAAAYGRLEVVKYLVGSGAAVDARTNNGFTALHRAAWSGHLDVVEFLVGSGLAVDAMTNNGRTPRALAVSCSTNSHLSETTRARCAAVADYLAPLAGEEPEEVRTPEEARAALARRGIDYTDAAFLDAARSGNLAVVKLFVAAGMSVNTANEHGFTALHWAAFGGRLAVMEYLVGQGADLEARDDGGNTALHDAARGGRLAVVKYLVENGASLTARTNEGNTALHWAARYGHLSVVKYLVENGANVNAKNNLAFFQFGVQTKSGLTPRDMASYYGHDAVADYLKSVGG